MALITGPLHSDDASGRFAGSLVFAKWKGRNYVRQLVTPANPRSAAQTGVRSMMAWLAQWWSTFTPTMKATWDTLAASKEISSFNAYVGENLDRWQYNAGPTKEYPAAEALSSLDADAIGIDGVILATTGAAGYADLSATPDTAGAVHATQVMIFRGDAAPTPFSWAKCIKIIEVTPGAEWTYTDSPLDPGTYHYKIAYSSVDGCVGALSAADNTAVVT